MKPLRICIGKGRGMEEVYELLEEADLPVSVSIREGPSLVARERHLGVTFVLARQADIPLLLLDEHVDIGIASSVWFIEAKDERLVCATELPVARCRVSVLRATAAPADSSIRSVCTGFPNLTKLHLPDTQIIRLTGCHEIAIALGFADAVVGVVETGSTLKAMDLREERIIAEIQHGIWLKTGRLQGDLKRFVDRLLSFGASGKVEATPNAQM